MTEGPYPISSCVTKEDATSTGGTDERCDSEPPR
jgi:hypothetical protein